MSGTVSTRWYFSDWMSDLNVRSCSLAARGLWMDMLCIASSNKGRDYGFVMIAGRVILPEELARHVGASKSEVLTLLEELEKNGVYSSDRRGIIYCRRMVRAEKNRTNGRLGGNPNLLKTKENQNSVQPKSKPLIPEPEPSLFPEEASGRSEAMPNPPLDLEADYFRRVREILGKSSGGMASLLLKAKGGNVMLARAAIETAATRGDAREYVGAMIRNGKNGGEQPLRGNGFAILRHKMMEAERENGNGAQRGSGFEEEPVSDRAR